MGKLSHLKRALDMSRAARMNRAAEQGFDTGRRMFHGTADDVAQFSPLHYGRSTGAKSARQGTWLVDDGKTARGYADYAAMDAKVKELVDKSQRLERQGKWDAANDAIVEAERLESEFYNNRLQGQNIMPLYAKGKYLEKDFGGAEFIDVEDEIHDLIKQAKREGYDGIRAHNLADDVALNGRPATHQLVFDPQNIRSENAAFDPANAALEQIMETWKGRGIDNFMSERNGVITLNKVIVPKEERGVGIGSAFMDELTRYADRTGQRIALTPSTDFGASSKKRLEEFYKRFGFTKNKSDYDISESMVRQASHDNISPGAKNDLLGQATPGGMATAVGLAAGAEFVRRRANKTQTLKGLGETALTVGSGLLGGFIGDLSRLGGYLNPFMSVEDTERGAEALSGSMQYIPSGAATPYLDRVSQGLEQAEKETAWAAGKLGWENSIPNKIYQALPERAQGIIDTTLL